MRKICLDTDFLVALLKNDGGRQTIRKTWPFAVFTAIGLRGCITEQRLSYSFELSCDG